jgi:hypothetical protein
MFSTNQTHTTKLIVSDALTRARYTGSDDYLAGFFVEKCLWRKNTVGTERAIGKPLFHRRLLELLFLLFLKTMRTSIGGTRWVL